MLMPDVNILVYAHRSDDPHHAFYRDWLERTVNDREPFCMSPLVAIGFVRIVTNRRIFPVPTPTHSALAVIDELLGRPNCRVAGISDHHWAQASQLCRAIAAKGKLVADAQHAAVAIAEGCQWVTRDNDFEQFSAHGLRWKYLSP